MRGPLLGAFLLISLLAAAVPAVAQDVPKIGIRLEASVEPPALPVDPRMVQTAPVTVSITIPGPIVEGALTVAFSGNGGPSFDAVFDPETVEVAYATSATEQTVEASTRMRIQPRPYAVAFMTSALTVHAATEGNEVIDAAEATTGGAASVAYLGTANVTVQTPHLLLDPLEESNGAYTAMQKLLLKAAFNGFTRVDFETGLAPSECLVALLPVAIPNVEEATPVQELEVTAGVHCSSLPQPPASIRMVARFNYASDPAILGQVVSFDFDLVTEAEEAGGEPVVHEGTSHPERESPAASLGALVAAAAAALVARRR